MSEPIRILHMIGTLEMGGSQAMVINLYKAIDRTKIQFDFVLDHPEINTLQPVVEEMGARVYYMSPFKGTNIVKIIKDWNLFFQEHPEYRILHSHVRSYASVYLPIAKKYGLKTIIHSHSTSNGKGFSAIVKALMQYPIRYQADYFFGCSEESGKWLFGEKIVKNDHFYIVKNAIDLKKYEFNIETRNTYRKKFIAEKGHVFIHIGRLHPAKNHMFLLEVFCQWKNDHPDDMLLVIGDGPLKDDIRNKVQELHIEQNVMLLGNRNDIADVLQAADCFLFPSVWEGVPVTVVEAQAAGLPCLISNVITDEVVFSDYVQKLPIDNGVDIWLEKMKELIFDRYGVNERIIQSGYDISTSAKWITTFYLECKNE